jgi:hypothetical protein
MRLPRWVLKGKGARSAPFALVPRLCTASLGRGRERLHVPELS